MAIWLYHKEAFVNPKLNIMEPATHPLNTTSNWNEESSTQCWINHFRKSLSWIRSKSIEEEPPISDELLPE